MGGRILDLRECTWRQVDALDRSRAVVLLWAGPVEQHGPHLPLGTDLFAAEWMTRKLAAYLVEQGMDVVVAPPIEYGTAVLSRPYPGSTSVRRQVLKGFLEDVLASFAQHGFSQLISTSQHIDPPYVLAWEEACRSVNTAYGARMVHGYERFVMEDVLEGRLSELLRADMEGDTHAGVFETSVMLYLRPELVDRECAGRLERVRLDYEKDLRRASSFRELGNGLGYTGYPADGTEWRGRVLMERYLDRYCSLIDSYIRGEDIFQELSIQGLMALNPEERDGQSRDPSKRTG